ncbi:NusA-like transcription termination signal-binding factor [Candidatus Woesearchaeota archaeon]|nr:NusA-like transcription termination signal-binding factor [Candidatus Woesearchaeota archaeon]
MISYNTEIIGYINVFETLTRTTVKDCFIDNSELVFMVSEGEAGRAIGKHGANIQRLSQMLNKKIKVIEFNKDVLKFINNLIYPANGNVYKSEEKTVSIQAKDTRDRAILIGRDRKNLKNLQNIVSKYFDVIIKIV